MGLTDKEQAFLMLFVFILPAIGVWAGLGFPTSREALGILASAIISGILVFLKEMLGWSES